MAERGRNSGAFMTNRPKASEPLDASARSDGPASLNASDSPTDGQPSAASPGANQPFSRRISEPDSTWLVDEILPPGTLLEAVSVDVLNGYINHVEPKVVVTERDPEEDERYISISNQFYTHFHEFGTVIHVIAATDRHLWYFCYDIDASYCMLGRVSRETVTLGQLIAWVYHERVSHRYPVVEINPRDLHGWRSFQ